VSLRVVHHDDWKGLAERAATVDEGVWPEFNLHGDVLNVYWERLRADFPEFQFLLYDDDADELLAEGHTIPFYWDDSREVPLEGIDAAIEQGCMRFDAGEAPNALCALAAEIPTQHQGKKLATKLLSAMADIARANGLERFLAPVRPNHKDRYPLMRIEDYVAWTRPDGMLFDPWMRVHVRMGGSILQPLPRSMKITGSVGEWTAWTGMEFPISGPYVIPGGLAPVEVDVDQDVGEYYEPNVWIEHPLD
jgi:GNAT superfamily N-acetyltransferase